MNQKLLFAGLAAMLLVGSVSAADTASLMAAGNQAQDAQQKISSTEQQLRLAVEQSGGSASANDQLATFLMSENRNQEAIEAYQEAIMAAPEDAGLFVKIAIAYLHEGGYSSANAMAARALTLDPDLAGAKKLALYIDKKQQQLAATVANRPAAAAGHSLPAGHPMPK